MPSREADVLSPLSSPIACTSTPEGVTRVADATLARAEQLLGEIRALAEADDATSEAVLGRLDEIHFALGVAGGAPYLMSEVHPSEAVRAAAREVEPRTDRFSTDLVLDRGLARAVKRVAARKDPLDGPTARLLEHTLRDLRRNGLDLDAQGQARLRDLNERMTLLGQTFGKNIAEATRSIEIAPSSLEGLPPEFVSAHREAALPSGNVVVTTDYPDYFPFMKYAKDREAAFRLYLEFDNRAAPANVDVLEELLVLRQEKARLLGYETWADYVIEPRMAKDGKTARSFLATVAEAVKAPAAKELGLLESMAAALGARPGEKLRAPDRVYLEEQVRSATYGLDSQALSQYFEVERVQQGLLDLTSRLYGIGYRPSDEAAWHEDVRAFDVLSSGRVVGRFFFDLYPRPAKFKHAAVFGIRPTKAFVDGPRAIPIAALVCNFPKPGGAQPALLTHDDVVTFFHEFGHVLHQLLTEVRLAAFSGTATARDFVEVPSQMFEEWAFRKDVLDGFARHHETGAPIPDSLFAALSRARAFGRALGTQRQLFLATLDLEYHTRSGRIDTTQVLEEIYTAHQPFEFVRGTHFQAAFGHLVGYDAGYYGYQWALSLSRDVLTRFQHEGFTSPKVAADWRAAVLSRGGGDDETEMVTRFLGRAPSPAAYIDYLREGAA